MIFNPNKEILPFHFGKHWHHTDKQCRDNEKYMQKLQRFTQYHFSTIIPNSWNNSSVKLMDLSDEEIGGDIFWEVITYYDHSTQSTFFTFTLNTEEVPIGKYYIQISDLAYEDDVMTSEPFCVKDNYSPEFTLEWSNKCMRVGNVVYQPIKTAPRSSRKLHLDGITVVLSDTNQTEEVLQDDFGNETPLSRFLTQKYMFSAALPFYVIEALTTLPLHSEVYLEHHNHYRYKLQKTEVISEPEEFGCFGKVTIKFEVNRISKAGCCDDSITLKVDYSGRHYDEDNYSTT